MPTVRRRVVGGLSETIATLPPQSALTSVDFPTFGRPTTAAKPDLASSYPHPGGDSYPPPSTASVPRFCARVCDCFVPILRLLVPPAHGSHARAQSSSHVSGSSSAGE